MKPGDVVMAQLREMDKALHTLSDFGGMYEDSIRYHLRLDLAGTIRKGVGALRAENTTLTAEVERLRGLARSNRVDTLAADEAWRAKADENERLRALLGDAADLIDQEPDGGYYVLASILRPLIAAALSATPPAPAVERVCRVCGGPAAWWVDQVLGDVVVLCVEHSREALVRGSELNGMHTFPAPVSAAPEPPEVEREWIIDLYPGQQRWGRITHSDPDGFTTADWCTGRTTRIRSESVSHATSHTGRRGYVRSHVAADLAVLLVSARRNDRANELLAAANIEGPTP